MILNVLIGDLFVIGLGIDLAPRRDRVPPPRHEATTQREMNHLYTEKADIYLAFRLQVRWAAPLPPTPLHIPLPTPRLTPHPSTLQLVGKLPVITLIYSSAIPICYALCALMMWMSMWIDRWNLLRMVVPPPRSPPWLISLMLCKILPGAPCLSPDTLPPPTAHIPPPTAPPLPPAGARHAHHGTGVMF